MVVSLRQAIARTSKVKWQTGINVKQSEKLSEEDRWGNGLESSLIYTAHGHNLSICHAECNGVERSISASMPHSCMTASNEVPRTLASSIKY